MIAENYIDLKRTFHQLDIQGDTENDDESYDFNLAFSRTHGKTIKWNDLLEKYRTVILAEAGVGKTLEIRQTARKLRSEGKAAFFLRLEYISDNFECSFEEGSIAAFENWLNSNEEGWVLLDSVDEARLKEPKDFETALRKIYPRINNALSRTHLFLTSRISAWRSKADLILCNELFSFQVMTLQENNLDDEADDNGDLTKNTEDSEGVAASKTETVEFEIYSLDDLSRDQVEAFLNAKEIHDTTEFISDVQRHDAWKYTSRPQDLEELIEFWRKNKRIGNHLELMEHSVQRRLTEVDQNRADSEVVSFDMLRNGAMKIAASATFSHESSISTLDGGYLKGINTREVLQDWTDNQIQSLLQRPIFDEGIYGAVRFHHRSVREFLTANWIHFLIQKNSDQKFIDNLFFGKKYGEHALIPSMRPVLSWLIILDERVLHKACKIDPQIIFECGDPSKLPIDLRSDILRKICNNMSSQRFDSATSYDAVQRFANSDIAGYIKSLLVNYKDNNEVSSFLVRMIWLGKIKELFPEAKAIATSNSSEKYLRTAAIRAVTDLGDESDLIDILNSLKEYGDGVDRDILAEVIDGISASESSFDMIFHLIEFSNDKDKYRDNSLDHSLTKLVERTPSFLLDSYLDKAKKYVFSEPFIEHRECEVSQRYSWLMNGCITAVRKQIENRSPKALSDTSLYVLSNIHVLKNHYDYGIRDELTDFSKLIEEWQELNIALFWKDVETSRDTMPHSHNRRVNSFWQVSIYGYFWSFSKDDFNQIIKEIEFRNLLDDKLIVLSLAFQLYKENERPRKWRETLKKVVEDQSEPELSERLANLLNPPPATEEEKRLKKREAYWKKRDKDRKKKEKQNLEKSISWLSENTHLIFNKDKLKKGEIIDAHVYLLNKIRKSDNSRFWSNADWKSLEPVFSFPVAKAFKDAATYIWRNHQPTLKSEKALDDNGVSHITILGLVGLEIESQDKSWVENLTTDDAELACRYAFCELNGFPSWFPALYENFPDIVLECLIQEVQWEIETTKPEQDLHYIISDIHSYANYLWEDVSDKILTILDKERVESYRLLENLVDIIQSSPRISDSQIETIAKKKCIENADQLFEAVWLSVWIGVNPKSAIKRLSKELASLPDENSTNLAMLVITNLVQSHRHRCLKVRNNFKTPAHLKKLYLLMCKYICNKEDINRANGGVYTPSLRDDAQDARDGVISLLEEIPGKRSYLALKKIAEFYPNANSRLWINNAAKNKVEKEIDSEAWTAAEFSEFSIKYESGDDWIMKHNISRYEKNCGFVFGVVFIVIILGFSILYPNPTSTQYATFQTVLALAAAGVGGIFSGFIRLEGKIQNATIRAGGALALFLIVYFFTPAEPNHKSVVEPFHINQEVKINSAG